MKAISHINALLAVTIKLYIHQNTIMFPSKYISQGENLDHSPSSPNFNICFNVRRLGLRLMTNFYDIQKLLKQIIPLNAYWQNDFKKL